MEWIFDMGGKGWGFIKKVEIIDNEKGHYNQRLNCVLIHFKINTNIFFQNPQRTITKQTNKQTNQTVLISPLHHQAPSSCRSLPLPLPLPLPPPPHQAPSPCRSLPLPPPPPHHRAPSPCRVSPLPLAQQLILHKTIGIICNHAHTVKSLVFLYTCRHMHDFLCYLHYRMYKRHAQPGS